MSGETIDVKNEPMTLSYEDLMNINLKLIRPTDLYKFNDKYDVYEDMSENEEYLEKTFDEAINLKIVGVVSAKPGVTTMALNPGVAYTSRLIDYIIDYSANTDIVKKTACRRYNRCIFWFKIDSKTNNFDLNFEDLVEIDKQKLQSAFNINIDTNKIQNQTAGYMNEISNAITTNTEPAKKAFTDGLENLAKGLFNNITDKIALNDIESTVSGYLSKDEPTKIVANLEANYVIPAETFKTTYSGLLKGLLQIYINSYYATDPSLTENIENPVAIVYKEIASQVITTYMENIAIQGTAETMAKAMTEAVMKKQF